MKLLFSMFLLIFFIAKTSAWAYTLSNSKNSPAAKNLPVISEKYELNSSFHLNRLHLQYKSNLPITGLENKAAKGIDVTGKETAICFLKKSSSGYMKKKASDNSLIKMSQDFLYAAKTGEETGSLVNAIENISWDDLKKRLISDNEKKAFWINLYNGFTQVILKNEPGKYNNRNKFFTNNQIVVAGNSFSLDEIEHGILRRSKLKWSLGYLNKFFPAKREKALRVAAIDYRIHFALNCGARSCPPIAFYSAENLDRELELATKAYLSGEVEYDSEKNVVHLPALMGWFRADFGGKKKMIELLRKINVIPSDSNPKIIFKKYDWNFF